MTLVDLLAPYGEYDDLELDREEVERFNEEWKKDRGLTMESCCTVDSFKFDIDGEPHSGWNESAAQVFAAHFIAEEGLPEDDYVSLKQAEDAFFTRIKVLRRALRKDTSQEARHHERSNSRKESVCTCSYSLIVFF